MRGPGPESDRALALAFGAAIAVGSVLLYWPVRGHEWLLWDDDVYITGNPHIAAGLNLESIRWAFTNFHLANWFPGTWISWMADFELHGFDAGAFLTTNLLLHALNSALLFAALRRATGSLYPSAFVAAVFAVHPLHVESVAWAAARKDVLSGLFWMLGLWFHSDSGAARRRRVATAICFALGFACKPTLITLPFALLLWDYWPLERGAGTGWRRARLLLADKAALLALAVGFAIVTFLAQRSGGTVQDLDALPTGMRLKNAASSYLAYLGSTLWPRRLAFFYPHPGDALSAWTAVGSVMILAAISVVAARARRQRYLIVGWSWFLGTLLPTIGIVQIGAQARADRYMYLPLIGLGIIVAWGVPELTMRLPGRRALLAAGSIAVVSALAAQTARQIPVWKDSISLFEHGLAVTSENHVAHAQLAGAYLASGRTLDAVEQYEAALQVTPDYTRVANNLAWLLATGLPGHDPKRAVELAEQAAESSDSSDPEILDTLAAAYASAGRFPEAATVATRAIALAESRGDAALAAELRERRGLYRSSRPYRERVE